MPLRSHRGSPRARHGRRVAALVLVVLATTTTAQAATRFAGPTSSQPLALSADGSLLAAVNPDKATVSFFDVSSDDEHRLARVGTLLEPWGVAVAPDGVKTWVANTAS